VKTKQELQEELRESLPEKSVLRRQRLFARMPKALEERIRAARVQSRMELLLGGLLEAQTEEQKDRAVYTAAWAASHSESAEEVVV
jgi:hypothetical protein